MTFRVSSASPYLGSNRCVRGNGVRVWCVRESDVVTAQASRAAVPSMHGVTSMHGGAVAVNVDAGLTAAVMGLKAKRQQKTMIMGGSGADDAVDDGEWGEE